MRHLAARDECERRVCGDPEQLLQPVADDLLDDGGRRPARVQPCVLVPGGGQPVRRERRRDGAADDESEVSAARDPDDPELARSCELLDYRYGIGGILGKRPCEGYPQLADAPTRWHRTGIEQIDEVCCDLGGTRQEPAFVRHVASSRSKRAGSSNGPTTAK